MKEEEQELYFQLCSNKYRSLSYSNEPKQFEVYQKQKGMIFKPKRKYRKRLIWIPLILKDKSETEPVFIYNLFKMMKKYDTEEIQKYQNYGIQDAGIGNFNSVELDKVNQSIDVSFNTFLYGQADMRYLIQLYKSYQIQEYYQLALVLEKYQDFINKSQNFISKFCKQKTNQLNTNEEFIKFVSAVKEWVNVNLENEIYEVTIGNIDLQKATPKYKKIIFSKNLIFLIGGELQDIYNQLSLQRNIDFLTNFIRKRQFVNGELEIEHTIKVLKNIINLLSDHESEEEIRTLDGYTIPTQRTNYTLFYDSKSGEISDQFNTYFFSVHKYNFKPQWIKFLIDQRSSRKNADKQAQQQNQFMISQTNVNNLEEICQKEYFLEKFNYISSKVSLIN